jgi:Fic family protein
MAHYQFEALHPFGDGNGRVGRLTAVLQLLRDGAIEHPALTISHWFLQHRDEYQEGLFNVSKTGDWNPWVSLVCQALSEQSARGVYASQQLLSWLAEVRGRLSERHWSGLIHELATDLIEWPIITLMFTAKKYGKSVPTAKSAIDRLVSINVLNEMTGKSYGRVYGARSVMAIVEAM